MKVAFRSTKTAAQNNKIDIFVDFTVNIIVCRHGTQTEKDERAQKTSHILHFSFNNHSERKRKKNECGSSNESTRCHRQLHATISELHEIINHRFCTFNRTTSRSAADLAVCHNIIPLGSWSGHFLAGDSDSLGVCRCHDSRRMHDSIFSHFSSSWQEYNINLWYKPGNCRILIFFPIFN